jgi:hypothetical protein
LLICGPTGTGKSWIATFGGFMAASVYSTALLL